MKPPIAYRQHLNGSRPFTGAWIETYRQYEYLDFRQGRPFTGAWIETNLIFIFSAGIRVAPSRGRGLKHG